MTLELEEAPRSAGPPRLAEADAQATMQAAARHLDVLLAESVRGLGAIQDTFVGLQANFHALARAHSSHVAVPRAPGASAASPRVPTQVGDRLRGTGGAPGRGGKRARTAPGGLADAPGAPRPGAPRDARDAETELVSILRRELLHAEGRCSDARGDAIHWRRMTHAVAAQLRAARTEARDRGAEVTTLAADNQALRRERGSNHAQLVGLQAAHAGLCAEVRALQATEDMAWLEREGMVAELDALRHERDALRHERDALWAEREARAEAAARELALLAEVNATLEVTPDSPRQACSHRTSAASSSPTPPASA